MLNVFDVNGLVFWNEEQIALRAHLQAFFAARIKSDLLALNDRWRFFQIEGPLLNPRDTLNANYTEDDIWSQDMRETAVERLSGGFRPLALRPETTPSSYAFAQYQLNGQLSVFPPLCVWQAGKSFRREIVQPTKHMRLKEFYQQEFQCIYTADTAMDYQQEMLTKVERMIASQIHLPTRIVQSDRLPSYSLRTMDVEVWNGDKWMEICSISKRTDFPQKLAFRNKKDERIKKDALVLEIAIGLDRCVYNWEQAQRTDINRIPPVDYVEEEEVEAHPS